MNTKNLYVLVSDGGDGSYSTVFTLDTAWIAQQMERDARGELDCDDIGVDGDGFHFTTIQVPSDATYESLNIHRHVDLNDKQG